MLHLHLVYSVWTICSALLKKCCWSKEKVAISHLSQSGLGRNSWWEARWHLPGEQPTRSQMRETPGAGEKLWAQQVGSWQCASGLGRSWARCGLTASLWRCLEEIFLATQREDTTKEGAASRWAENKLRVKGWSWTVEYIEGKVVFYPACVPSRVEPFLLQVGG